MSETRSQVCDDVDRTSPLSDDLLVKILSFLPTRVAVSTSILSKRWECLWMWLPKLKFEFSTDSESEDYEVKSLRRFLDLNLPLHRAPIIKSFHLDIYSSVLNHQDAKLWLVIALSRYLRKLKVTYLCLENPSILPSSLYTSTSLVSLKLHGRIRMDVPRLGCLPSLKTLQLMLEKYLEGESLRRLLSICPVLEDLLVYCDRESDDMGVITVTVPSLQRLSIHVPIETGGGLDGLVIDTPSLKYLKLRDLHESRFIPLFSIEAMPNLEEAYVEFRYEPFRSPSIIGSVTPVESLMGSITSVKRLTICSHILYGDGLVFNQLEHLKLCACTGDSLNLLARLLDDSPNLRVLDIFIMDHYGARWLDLPDTVDESIKSCLQAFDWSRYLERRPQDMDLAVYILE